MKFCPTCNKHLVMTTEDKSLHFKCVNCGYSQQIEKQSTPSSVTNQILETVITINPEATEISEQALIHTHCPKCSNQQAHYTVSEINEEEAILFRCTHCHFVWREAD